jgi:hypothetical protein
MTTEQIFALCAKIVEEEKSSPAPEMTESEYFKKIESMLPKTFDNIRDM